LGHGVQHQPVAGGHEAHGSDDGDNGTNVNELTHQRLTDLGRAPSFYDCAVQVQRLG
jgi:anaerobic selenocysteine-containing dehydrogenase